MDLIRGVAEQRLSPDAGLWKSYVIVPDVIGFRLLYPLQQQLHPQYVHPVGQDEH
ncbi:hypothetical protein D3C76_1828020 [compost metagenome]